MSLDLMELLLSKQAQSFQESSKGSNQMEHMNLPTQMVIRASKPGPKDHQMKPTMIAIDDRNVFDYK